MAEYRVKWSNLRGADRQALPARLRATNRYDALELLGRALRDAKVQNMPGTVTLVLLSSRRMRGSACVTLWRVP